VTDKFEVSGHKMFSACEFAGVIEDFISVGCDPESMDLEPSKIKVASSLEMWGTTHTAMQPHNPKSGVSACLRPSYDIPSWETIKIVPPVGRSQSQFSNPFRISSDIRIFSLETCPYFIPPFLGSLIQRLNHLSSKIHENIALD
jgi:hypothetical protein